MKKCNIYKEKFESDSLQRHTVKSTRNSMDICGFFSVQLRKIIRKIDEFSFIFRTLRAVYSIEAL